MSNQKLNDKMKNEKYGEGYFIETPKTEPKATQTPTQNQYLIAFCSQSNIIQRTTIQATTIKEAIAKFSALGYDKDMIFAVTNLGE